jgi:hypothetical protein
MDAAATNGPMGLVPLLGAIPGAPSGAVAAPRARRQLGQLLSSTLAIVPQLAQVHIAEPGWLLIGILAITVVRLYGTPV